jgi:hypothetical protein
LHIKFPVDPVFDNGTFRRGRYLVGNKSIEVDSNANNPGNPYNLRSVIKTTARTHVRTKFPVVPDCGLRSTTWEPSVECHDIRQGPILCLAVRRPQNNYYLCRNCINITPVRQAIVLHQVLNFLFVFWVTNTRYDFVECTIETGVLENMGVAVEIFDVSFIDSEIRGGSNFTPGCAIT